MHAAAQDPGCRERDQQITRTLRGSIRPMNHIPRALRPAAVLLASAAVVPACATAQPTAPPQTPQARIARLMAEPQGAWTPQQIATMQRLRDAALSDPYAYTELRHLTDNIGPRIA